MASDQHKTLALILSDRKVLVNTVRQALTEMKFSDAKKFVETVDEAMKELDASEEAIIVLDWDLGPNVIHSFFESAKARTKRELWSIYICATEPSDKILAAGAEYGAARVSTGGITSVKVKLAIEDLLKDIKLALPLKNVFRKVQEARQNDEWETSTKLLEELQKKEPANRRVVAELAENYLQMKNWQAAFDIVDPETKMNPPDTRILHIAGRALIKLGRHEEAANLMQKADLINPFNVDRLLDLGNTLLQLDRVSEAGEKFDRAKTLDPDSKEALAGQGTVKLLDGDVNEALKLLKDSVTGRELASVFNTAAIVSMRSGKFESGIKLYETAEKVLQANKHILARIFFNKGLGFIRWKKLDEAKKSFQEAVKLDPDYQNAKHNLAALSNDSVEQDVKSITQNLVGNAGSGSTHAKGGSESLADDLADEDERI